MGALKKEFFLWRKRTKLPPTEWWCIVVYCYRDYNNALYEFYF